MVEKLWPLRGASEVLSLCGFVCMTIDGVSEMVCCGAIDEVVIRSEVAWLTAAIEALNESPDAEELRAGHAAPISAVSVGISEEEKIQRHGAARSAAKAKEEHRRLVRAEWDSDAQSRQHRNRAGAELKTVAASPACAA